MPSPERFRKTLTRFSIAPETVARINEGYETLADSAPKKERGAYFKRAMAILDREVEWSLRVSLMDENGCCKSGARDKASRRFAKEHAGETVEQRLAAIPGVRNMGVPSLTTDGLLHIDAVRYFRDGRYRCACPNYNDSVRDNDVSDTYCLCCAGHFRYHYQIMLGVTLGLERVASSPFSSDGREPCAFLFRFIVNR